MVGQLGAAAAWMAPEAGVHIEEVLCLAQGAAACEFLLRWEAGG
jgi:hypothetical protein